MPLYNTCDFGLGAPKAVRTLFTGMYGLIMFQPRFRSKMGERIEVLVYLEAECMQRLLQDAKLNEILA
jgi:hypothetical protein